MNEEKLEKLGEVLKTIQLSNEEKSATRNSLLEYSEYKKTVGGPAEKAENENLYGLWLVGKWFTNPVFLSIIAVLILVGGVSAYAEESVPGDILYPVKINFNEPIRDFAELSSSGQAFWEIKKAERRIVEAEKVALNGNLDMETRDVIEEKIAKNIKNISLKANELKNDEAKDVEDELDAVLDVHKGVLTSLEEKKSEAEAEEIKTFKEKLIESGREFVIFEKDINSEKEESVDEEEAKEELRKADKELQKATKYADQDKTGELIKVAQTIFDEAELVFGDRDFESAIAKSEEAYKIARKTLIAFNVDDSVKEFVYLSKAEDELTEDSEKSRLEESEFHDEKVDEDLSEVELEDKSEIIPKSGIEIISPKAGEKVKFPIQIAGYINDGGWLANEGEAVSAQVFDSNDVAVSDITVLKAKSDWLKFPVEFEASIDEVDVINTDEGYILFRSIGAKDDDEISEYRLPVAFQAPLI